MRRLLALLALAGAAAGWELERSDTFEPKFPVADCVVADVDGDGRAELLVVGIHGEVRTWSIGEKGGHLGPPRGDLVLADPEYTLLALADVLGTGRPQLLVLSRDGASVHAFDDGGAAAAEGVRVAARARFRLRTGQPVFADVVQDVDRDGRPDVVLPGQNTCELWVHAGAEAGDGGAGAVRLRKAATVAVDVRRFERHDVERLSDQLVSSFSVPRLRTRDVNGDGREDLLVEIGSLRMFHMQAADGTIPPEPDVVLDLGIFRDTTPAAAIRPGRTLAGGDRTSYQSRDLDGDGIPDYVIAHRRKVWVFHGNRDKPQFVEPTAILKVSDDVTALLPARLNDDGFLDLLILKVQIPTVATLLLGALGEWDVEVTALGYANTDGRTFERAPRWRSEITVRLPSILKIMKNPSELVGRFEELGKKFRRLYEADLDGDGVRDVLLLDESETHLEFWHTEAERKGDRSARENLDDTLRSVLFEEEDKTWTIDRILELLAGMAEQRATQLTGGRPPDAAIALRTSATFEFLHVSVGDLDGDGREEAIVRYVLAGSGATARFDVLRLK